LINEEFEDIKNQNPYIEEGQTKESICKAVNFKMVTNATNV
jgi:hypothetical protein